MEISSVWIELLYKHSYQNNEGYLVNMIYFLWSKMNFLIEKSTFKMKQSLDLVICSSEDKRPSRMQYRHAWFFFLLRRPKSQFQGVSHHCCKAQCPESSWQYSDFKEKPCRFNSRFVFIFIPEGVSNQILLAKEC